MAKFGNKSVVKYFITFFHVLIKYAGASKTHLHRSKKWLKENLSNNNIKSKIVDFFCEKFFFKDVLKTLWSGKNLSKWNRFSQIPKGKLSGTSDFFACEEIILRIWDVFCKLKFEKNGFIFVSHIKKRRNSKFHKFFIWFINVNEVFDVWNCCWSS